MHQRAVIALAVLAAVALLILLPAAPGGGSGGDADVPPVRLQPQGTSSGDAQ
jgi:hypothetical protein